ncbi:MAG: hypothetical protein OXB98_06090 [Bryobacterales bacterium]|nr:hypothetical protein [Bryobacterales bacterium]
MSKPITYEEHPGPDGEHMLLPVIPPDASMEQIEDIVSEEGTAIMNDAQYKAFTEYINEGVTPDGRVR